MNPALEKDLAGIFTVVSARGRDVDVNEIEMSPIHYKEEDSIVDYLDKLGPKLKLYFNETAESGPPVDQVQEQEQEPEPYSEEQTGGAITETSYVTLSCLAALTFVASMLPR